MKMIATRQFNYAGRSLKAGDAFEASTRDARVLAATGRAKAAPVPAPAPASIRAGTQARDMRADADTPDVGPGGEPTTKRGRYRRRDQRAEDDATEE
ncbi:hypothetical protein SB861_03375 [Paraburkholderia sp. SIMBA_049]